VVRSRTGAHRFGIFLMVMPRPLPKDCRSGFALLITITLLAFLVLLLVSLASLTRVETQVAANSQQMSKARQNALMALNIALGRLQALAGPDQRITATADLIAGVHDTKRRWTGVWNTTAATPSPEWLVSTASGTAPTGTTTSINTALSSTGTVTLVGNNTVDTTVAGNAVAVETQPISTTAPGLSGPQTIGNFAYWVGDEGVKAKVNLTDPGAAPTATAAEKTYRFINSQRFGIEGMDSGATGTPLSTNYPANADDLPKVLDLKQLSMLSAGGQTALSAAAKNRFHDLTATSLSVLSDVAKGGLKKDLTAWIVDPAAPSNPVSANASDDYITPGDPADTGKYGLPKWTLIRSYATTFNTGSALAPQQQTTTQQGISPVITYARMGYNLSMDGSGNYHINIMPVVALWNPYNVPLQASSDDSNTYEFCVKYKSQITATTTYDRGVQIKMWFSDATLQAQGSDSFMLPTIQMWTATGTPTFKSYAASPSPTISSSAGTVPVFWRFKVKLSKTLAPGESRLFTIDDTFNEQVYAAGISEMTDRALGNNNAVYIPSNTPLTAAQRADPLTHVFWQTEPDRIYIAMMQVILTKPGLATDQLRSDNAYQTILGNGFEWNSNPNPAMLIGDIPMIGTNTGVALNYQRIQLVMSESPTEPTSTNNGLHNSGTPRWLATFNPLASVALRNPLVANPPANSYDLAAMITPSYQNEGYVPYTALRSYHPIPNADGTNVSAGTQVATTGTAQNVVLREFQPDATTLLSLGQLQHVNASLLNLNPAYPIGNSLANLYVPRTSTESPTLAGDAYTAYTASGMDDTYPGFPTSSQFQHIYDLSYLLNKALWDGYFFSTIPSTLTASQVTDASYHLPNARHLFYSSTGTVTTSEVTELKASGTAAAHLLVNGGFNVNSTSEQAWRALLYSHNDVATDPSDPTKKHPYSRQTAPSPPSQPNTTWTGYRILSDVQIQTLAAAIVTEVRKRGPFLSLADFINRRLVADGTGLKGPLQTAIDATISGATSVNGIAPFNSSSMRVTAYPLESQGNTLSDPEQQAIYVGSTTTTLPSTLPASSRPANAPGYLTQADLLNTLGPSLTARSDTFRIRAYGDVINPATGGTTPDARAWCEAIVQRLPDYVEASVNPASPPTAGSASATFGRRFKIASFRWLSPNDI